MIEVYIGDGKGKSTAALGLLIRACGAGRKTLYCQFLKTNSSSEINILSHLGERVTLLSAEPVTGFFKAMSAAERERVTESQRLMFKRACKHIKSGKYKVAVLDELLWAYSFELISRRDILNLFEALPSQTELVLTGRSAPDFIIEAADYVSEIKKIKHPFDKNIPARQGIEY